MANENTTTEEEPIVVTEEQGGAAEAGTEQQPLAVEEGIEDLRAQLAAAKARADRAERAANAASSQIDQAQDEVTRSNLAVITGAIDQLNQNKDVLKAKYADAMSSGDFALASDINSQMADNAAKLLNLENGKIAIETAPKREARRTAVESGDPVERKLAQWGLTSASADWVRAHPEYALDENKTQAMLAAHNLAVTIGGFKGKEEAPEYFAYIERTLGIGGGDARPAPKPAVQQEAPLSNAAAPAQRRDAAPPPAAPASRGNQNSRTIRLTKEQAEAAKFSGLTNEEYAKQVARLASEKVH